MDRFDYQELEPRIFMKPKMIVKTGVDIAMTIAMLLLMAYQLIGEEAHEWIGVFMFVLFVTHHLLNGAWGRNILRGKYNARRILQTVIVFLILLCMAGSMVSGIILSRYVFASLNIRSGVVWAGSVHILCAYWGFILMSIHLGFHWNIMITMAGKVFSEVPKGIRTALRVIAVLIAVYGGVAFVKRDIWNYMILKNHFAFYDFSEPVVFFLLDYLAVMGLFVFVGHYLGRRLMRNTKDGFK